MNNAIEIITDGSYANHIMGIGYVRIVKQFEDDSYDLISGSAQFNKKKAKAYGSQAAEAMAVACALDDLNTTGYDGDVIIYCDLNSLEQYINGEACRIDAKIQYIYDELDQQLDNFSSVGAMHPKHAKHLSPDLHKIAHNLSAET